MEGEPIPCPECNGTGVSRATAPVVKVEFANGRKVYETTKQGSGCTLCLGAAFFASQAEVRSAKRALVGVRSYSTPRLKEVA